METLKILIFNWRDVRNPDAWGAELFTHEVARRRAATGHNITLFTSKFPSCRKEQVIHGVKIIRDGGRYTVYRKAKKHYRERLRREKYDVVVDEIDTRPFLTPRFVKGEEAIFGLIHQLAREYWFYETPFPLSWIGYHILEKRLQGINESSTQELHMTIYEESGRSFVESSERTLSTMGLMIIIGLAIDLVIIQPPLRRIVRTRIPRRLMELRNKEYTTDSESGVLLSLLSMFK